MSKIQVNIQKSADSIIVKIAGVIDEDFIFSQYSISEGKTIDFDLSEVKGINSCGIREWIKWMETVKEAKINLLHCPKVIVDQMNMVQGFLPANGRVHSFFVPFYNEDSGEEKMVEFNFGKEFTDQGQITMPKVQDSAGQDMEVDVIESKYFKFLKRA
jgi:hypothetical protein